MKDKKIYSLLFVLSFMLSCTSSRVPVRTEVTKEALSSRVEATKFEEVNLVTSNGDTHKGKIVSLEGESIELRPFPYWNVELVRLHLDEIRTIKLVKKESRAAKGLASGFGWAFVIVGTIGGLSSTYNEDYEAALLGSAVLGGAGGLLGLLVGAFQDFTTKTKFEFTTMSKEEKERAIRKIMGVPVK